MGKYKYTISLALIFALGIVAWGFILHQSQECSKQGGTYVRGVAWFECINKKE